MPLDIGTFHFVGIGGIGVYAQWDKYSRTTDGCDLVDGRAATARNNPVGLGQLVGHIIDIALDLCVQPHCLIFMG